MQQFWKKSPWEISVLYWTQRKTVFTRTCKIEIVRVDTGVKDLSWSDMKVYETISAFITPHYSNVCGIPQKNYIF